MNRFMLFGASSLFSLQTWAFPCHITLAKDSCWLNYDVKIAVVDATANKQLTVVEVPKGQSWTRQSFECQPAQKLMYQATFTPYIWQNEIGKIYYAQRYWFLPAAVTGDTQAWNIPVCYASDFSEVPLPPDAVGNCKCDFKSIPPVQP